MRKLYEVLDPVDNLESTDFVDGGDVAAVQPSIGVVSFPGLGLVVVVCVHHKQGFNGKALERTVWNDDLAASADLSARVRLVGAKIAELRRESAGARDTMRDEMYLWSINKFDLDPRRRGAASAHRLVVAGPAASHAH